MRPSSKRAAATTAPVFPAETRASVWWSFWSRAETLIEESRFRRTEDAADSAISTRSVAWMMRGSLPRTPRRSASSTMADSSPTSATSNEAPDSWSASSAPWMTTRGARSPPMASTPMTGPLSWAIVRLADALGCLRCLPDDDLLARVVAAVSADAVRELGLAAVRAYGARRKTQLPVRAALLAACARVPSLGDGHTFRTS
jgi:hypothetical protein